ncbi:MinD/ParA family protein [Geomonas nitrogeniifigens]|uniref:MinD/ParA family protein n=1 Tax=Geomonas diazotrophica TaxID=2843197 RepID=A0ABX8JF94_9BACT|nr:MinD/ParA family protein [Geomonas nitrogeniifigens]QWV97055.1 MinD/ParA family protein [Geomonas nitrogeniifigens]
MTMSCLATDQAESLRRLAGRAKTEVPEQLQLREGLRVISVTSGKGGVGKTSVVVNLAAALAARGERVLIVDSNPGVGDICLRLGKDAPFRMGQVLSGEVPLKDTVVELGGGVSVLPAGMDMQQYSALSPWERGALLQAMLRLQNDFDYFLIDTGSGIAANLTGFASLAREIMLVVTPEPTSITDAYALIKMLSGRDSSFRFRLLINMCRDNQEGETLFSKLAAITGRFLQVQFDHAGSILHDELLVESVRRRGALYRLFPDAKASTGFKNLALKINAERPAGAGAMPVASVASSTMWRNHELSS